LYGNKKMKLDGLSPEELQSKIRNSALGSVGMREHSVAELRQKLEQKFEHSELILAALDWLLELGYLNDSRFAEIFVRASITKGRGPVRIRQELQQKGVAQKYIFQGIDEVDVDWQQQAAAVLARKFRSQPADQKERAKQMRFLQSRGYCADHIYPLFKS
jgi:regulatory protein